MQHDTQVTYAFNIDRGGTFTDFYVQQILNDTILNQTVYKVPSQNADGEGPIIGIRKYLHKKGLIQSNQKIPVKYIQHINLGTTIATNALLERKGCKNVMLLTEGFGDLLRIRHQARPNIFDLKCEKKPPLAFECIQIKERTYLNCNPRDHDLVPINVNNKHLYQKKPEQHQLEELAEHLNKQGIQSVGISFTNSYLSAGNQQHAKEYLQTKGIKNIELGSNYKDLGYLKRSETASLDAFLNPIMSSYFRNFQQEFDNPSKLHLRIMKSDGGFSPADNVKASQLLLSGPAGGLIGCQSIISVFQKTSQTTIKNLICLDMGGTSTDISRIEQRKFATKYGFEIEGIQLCTPHLQIDTIAAGGGSKLSFYNGMFVVGPQSVGSNPGPVCYGIGQQLALTDANLILGRLDQTYFPKIFGKNRNEGLNRKASHQTFTKLGKQINQKGVEKSIEQIAEGYVEIANELMAKSTRKLLTMGIPDALVVFGSAGGQHCCDLAQKVGVSKIFIHKFSGALSAYGLSKASESKENKVFLGTTINKHSFNFKEFSSLIQSYKTKDISRYSQVIYEIGIGYQGTSYTIKVPFDQNMVSSFEINHKQQNGFSLKTPILRVQYFVQTLIKHPHAFELQEKQYAQQNISKYLTKESPVFIGGAWKNVPFYDIEHMNNCIVQGPALLLSSTASILVKPKWTAKITHQVVFIYRNQQHIVNQAVSEKNHSPDPIKLTLYSTRLMSIAEEMGKILQKISISTNIRERLDFSCGIFDWDGKLLANAPHLPVHLGSMETAVAQQIKRGIKVGDVVLTNHPIAGGSHLPDLTVVTCTEVCGTRMYLASRGHHADIGGITPGSMPAFSKSLDEQGVAIEKFELMKDGEFQQQNLRQLFKQSRRIEDNVSDLLAQVAANEIGGKLITKFINEYGIAEFKEYVGFICQNAEESVRSLLCQFSLKNNLKQVDTLINREYMDDGTCLQLNLTIDRNNRSAVFDFSGTGPQVMGNTNAPKSITRSAILYCLRSLIGQEIPLNSGCLVPLAINIPQNTILSPSRGAAVVGGNVQTSQKLVDLILKPFNYVASSYGTMNNFIFGNQNLCYYQTICGGSGAGEGFNGTTVQCHMTNTRITDVEYLQKTYPVIVKQFKERKGSGGKGVFTGGNGAIRQFIFLENVIVSILSERRVFSGYGINGGENGQTGKNSYINKEGILKNVGSKNTFKVLAGETVRIETPSGGGYGKLTV